MRYVVATLIVGVICIAIVAGQIQIAMRVPNPSAV
jgi:hypothetical protein